MQKKRIASDNINKIFVDYLHNRKGSYWYFSYMPTMVCLLEDIFFTFGLVFQAHTLPNFNVCFNIHRLAFILDNSKETRELCTDYDRWHESSLWEHAMSNWMSAFAQKYGLNSNFEYLYFFNLLGDATLYLNLTEQQLTALQKFFVEEHDAARMTHRWSYEIVPENNFLEHMVSTLGMPFMHASNMLAYYALKSIDTIEHNRSCSFSMLPLRPDLMRSFIQKNGFFKPTTQISFEYVFKSPVEDVALYTCWVDFMLFAFQLYCTVFGIQIRLFSVAHREDNRFFINFYFENEAESETYSDLLQNLAANSFGVRLVPGSAVNPGLIEVISTMAKLDRNCNFVDLIPSEKISHYALSDFDKRLTLRNHSYGCDESNKEIQTFRALSRMVDLFTGKIFEIDDAWENHKLWFNPGEL